MRKRWTKSDLSLIAETSDADAAERLGVSKRAVLLARRRYGLPPEPLSFSTNEAVDLDDPSRRSIRCVICSAWVCPVGIGRFRRVACSDRCREVREARLQQVIDANRDRDQSGRPSRRTLARKKCIICGKKFQPAPYESKRNTCSKSCQRIESSRRGKRKQIAANARRAAGEVAWIEENLKDKSHD